VDCSSINPGGKHYYPVTPLAHGCVAFNEYYQQNANQGASACYFNGAAELVICSTACTICKARDTAESSQLLAAMSWLCADAFVDCQAIQPGGKHFFPNTTVAHADYLYNQYYQGYKCIPASGPGWCDFNGTAEIVNC
jgi:hypothetical protein